MSHGKKHRGMDQITECPFKSLEQYTSAGSIGVSMFALNLRPSELSDRVSTMSTLFKKWRLSKLKVSFWTDMNPVLEFGGGGTGVACASGFLGAPGDDITTAPTNLEELVELVRSDVGISGQKHGYTVPRADLARARPMPWLYCEMSSDVVGGQTKQGAIFSAVDSTVASTHIRLFVQLSGIVEFSEPVDPLVAVERLRGEAKEAYTQPGTASGWTVLPSQAQAGDQPSVFYPGPISAPAASGRQSALARRTNG